MIFRITRFITRFRPSGKSTVLNFLYQMKNPFNWTSRLIMLFTVENGMIDEMSL